MNVLLSVLETTYVPTRLIAVELEITRSPLTRFLKAQKFHSPETHRWWSRYKTPVLRKNDGSTRKKCCKYTKRPVFDESTFTLNDEVNHQMCRYWTYNSEWGKNTLNIKGNILPRNMQWNCIFRILADRTGS